MDIVRIIGIGITAIIIISIVKQYKPEFTIYVSLITGVLILILLLDKLNGIINLLKSITNKTDLNSQYIYILLKITGIALLTEFGVSICKDSGEIAIANKIDFAGRIIIITISIPIITALLEVLLKILP